MSLDAEQFPTVRALGARDFLVSLGLFLVVALIYTRSPVTQSSDSRWTIPGAVSLLTEGNLAIDEFSSRVSAGKRYSVIEINGRLYSYFPPFVTVLAAPFVAVLAALPQPVFEWVVGVSDPSPTASRHRARERRGSLLKEMVRRRTVVERFVASVFVAAATVCVFLYSCRTLPISWSLGLAIVFAFGTSAWSSASRAMWQHAPSLFFVSFGLLMSSIPRGRSAFAAGASFALAYAARPTNGLSVLAGALLTGGRGRRPLMLFGGGAIIVLLCVLAAQRLLLGTWFPPYFAVSRLTFHSDLFEAITANLISPSRGVFVFSPVLILTLGIIPRMCRSPREFKAEWLAFAVIAAHTVAVSAIDTWWAGHSYGPRFMCDVLPFFFVLLVRFLAETRRSLAEARRDAAGSRQIPPYRKVILAGMLAILALLSLALHAPGALSMRSMQWNSQPLPLSEHPQRVWDIGDPQFLRWNKGR